MIPILALALLATPAPSRNACLSQNGRVLRVEPIRAMGTEPFWGAAISGRCVTYSELDDQRGTRIWTRYRRGTWTGAYRGKPFVLRARPDRTCSDGMSDRIYPIAIDLRVGGQRRTGCAFNP